MMSIVKGIASALARHLVHAMPERRRDWALGMQVEIEEIENPAEALMFAAGCAWTAQVDRLMTIAGILNAAKVVLSVSVLVLAVIAGRTAWMLSQAPAHIGPAAIVAVSGLTFLSASFVLLRRSVFPPIFLASTMMAVSAAGYVFVTRSNLSDGDFLHAVFLEGIVLWGALILACLGLAWARRSPLVLRVADRLGWEA